MRHALTQLAELLAQVADLLAELATLGVDPPTPVLALGIDPAAELAIVGPETAERSSDRDENRDRGAAGGPGSRVHRAESSSAVSRRRCRPQTGARAAARRATERPPRSGRGGQRGRAAAGRRRPHQARRPSAWRCPRATSSDASVEQQWLRRRRADPGLGCRRLGGLAANRTTVGTVEVSEILAPLKVRQHELQAAGRGRRVAEQRTYLRMPPAMRVRRPTDEAAAAIAGHGTEGSPAPGRAVKPPAARRDGDLRAVSLLRRHEAVRGKYADRYRYILVDEYQDTNHAQYELTRLLGRDHRNVCAVGDPDQAIYGWRGADIGNIRAFEEDLPECTVVNLERNYRSRGNIVAAAASLIAFNGDRADKTLWTGRAAGAGIRHLRTDSDHDEANAIAGIVAAQPEVPRQTAVLYRTNAQSRLIEDALRRAEIPYHIVGNIRFYERKEIKDALAYLKVIVNPHDDVSLRRIINSHSPPRGIGPRSIEKAAGGAPGETPAARLFAPAPAEAGEGAGAGASLWTRLREGCAKHRLTGAALAKMQGFIDLIDRMHAGARGSAIARTVEETIGHTGYLKCQRSLRSEGYDQLVIPFRSSRSPTAGERLVRLAAHVQERLDPPVSPVVQSGPSRALGGQRAIEECT